MNGQTTDNVTSADTGTVDTLAKTIKSQQDFHRYWMSAIELAGKTEKDWREDAKTAIDQTNRRKPRTADNELFIGCGRCFDVAKLFAQHRERVEVRVAEQELQLHDAIAQRGESS